jgi:ABC-type sugar transport system ATPase subunit
MDGWGNMTSVSLINVSNYILKSITTEFPSRKLSVVVGPNGSGKTTLLKTIMGIVRYKGDVLFNGENVNSLPPYKRNVSYVPQNNALFSNLSVYENIAFGLKARDVTNVDERVKGLAEMLGISELLERYPATLSGGEARKVAIARALAIDPDIVLLDEPFTNLDPNTQNLIEQEIMMIVRKLNKTVILVTHSIEKAVCAAHKLLVLYHGNLIYSGSPHNLVSTIMDERLNEIIGNVVDIDDFECMGGFCIASVGESMIPSSTLPHDGLKPRKVLIPPGSLRITKRGGYKAIVRWVRGRHGKYIVGLDLMGRDLVVTAPFQPSVGETLRIRIDNSIPL